ncbi:MAG: hypothetical protein EOM24_04340, partial [Chloroflexia bacterium]|nr:hypothetical protein [Chloroflexia bacterium]
LGFKAFDWQQEALDPGIDRLVLLCGRQSGKSTAIAALCTHKAKYQPGSLILLFSPTEDQSEELMSKISTLMSQDEEIILIRDSSETKKLLNGSRIKAFSASPKAARGYSDPDIIVFDEAAQVPRELYLTVRPMMTGGKTTLILLSTPFGKEGFFYDTWTDGSPEWTRVMVKPTDVLHEIFPDKYPEIDEQQWVSDQAKDGVKAYISPRHKKPFLREELRVMGEHWYRQEYACEFLNAQGSLFDMADVDAAFGMGQGEKVFNYGLQLDTVKADSFWRV